MSSNKKHGSKKHSAGPEGPGDRPGGPAGVLPAVAGPAGAARGDAGLDPGPAQSAGFPIVAIGASAGGLKAIQAFMGAMPPDSGAAFVLVQHLSPDHTSMMAEIIGQSTKMETRQVEDGMRVAPNTVYTMRPGRDLLMERGLLRLVEPESTRGVHMPIDRFFASLAEDQHENAICVLLSGTGSDGTLSLVQVKDFGGMTIAQNDEALYPDMPRNAVQTGLIDYVMTAQDMPGKILELIHNRGALPTLTEAALAGRDSARSHREILRQLKRETGHDFSLYKRTTVARRIQHRMTLLGIPSLKNYVEYIRKNPAEQRMLFQDLLIGVTQFFRDPEPFEKLATRIIPDIFGQKSDGESVRAWVPGCSTGEEAYSIAMLMSEYASANARTNPVRIFATDIDEDRLETARAGIYPKTIEAQVAPDRLGRFFTKEGDRYRISKSLREMVVFARHNLAQEPPFSRLDLISCRNLLIYLSAELQRKVLPILYYALNPSGYLLLGTSESMVELAGMLTPVDMRHKIFQRRARLPGETGEVPRLPAVEPRAAGSGRREGVAEVGEASFAAVEKILLEQFVHPSVVVNERDEALHFYGQVDPFFRVSAGGLTNSVLLLAEEGFRPHLRNALRLGMREGKPVRGKGFSLTVEGRAKQLQVLVTPLTPGQGGGRLFLVVIEPVADSAPAGEPFPSRPQNAESATARLERELKETRAELNATIGDLEISNEELMSANEELSTSMEELQSTNEELVTVNAEMRSKVEELARSNSDLQNLMNSTRIATVFLDLELAVRWFTPQMADYLHILDTDIGRPFAHLRPKVDYPQALEDMRQVLADLMPIERQIQSEKDCCLTVRIMPYRSAFNEVNGLVVTFLDVTEVRRAERQLCATTDELESLYKATPDITVRVDRDNRILGLRAGSVPNLIPDPAGLLGRKLEEAFPGAAGRDLEDAVRLARADNAQRSVGLAVLEHGVERFLEARVFPAQEDTFLVVRDMTELRRAEARNTFQADALAQVSDALVAVDNTGEIILWNGGAERILGVAARNAVGKSLQDVTGSNWIKEPEEAPSGGESEAKWQWLKELEPLTRDGRQLVVEALVTVIRDGQGRKAGLLAVMRDITERKRFEGELLDAKLAAEEANRAKSEFLANMSHEFRTPLTGVLGLSQLLLNTPLNEKQRTYLTGIMDSASNLVTIVQDILDLAKIEAHKVELAQAPFNLEETLAMGLTPLRLDAESKGLEFRLTIIPGVPRILLGDAARLRQIMTNLAGNAVKFTPRGAVDIQVGILDPSVQASQPGRGLAAEATPDARRVRLLFSVRDTGIGIAPEKRKNIFDMFVQGEQGFTKTYSGVGLGLAITRNLVEMMGGGIWVISQEGEGSTFYCALPFMVPISQDTIPPSEPIIRASTASHPLNILVAEDNALNRLFIETLLEERGHAVTGVANGQAALEALERVRFDVVFMDISMPVMDGMEATRRIRAATTGKIDPHTFIVALTGHVFPEDKERLVQAGVNEFLAKPIDVAKLEEALVKASEDAR